MTATPGSATPQPAAGPTGVPALALGPPVQIAYVTDDVRRVAQEMADRHRAGPFFVIERIALEWGEVAGERHDFLHTSAYGWWGEVMVEIVQPDDDGPSPFHEPYGPGGPGLHHLATFVDDLAATYAAVEAAGLSMAAKARTATGTEFAFVDTRATHGHLFEIYEPSDGLRGFYAMVRSASIDWDGTDAVRTLSR